MKFHQLCSYSRFALLLSSMLLLVGCQRKAVVSTTRVSLAPTTNETSPFDVAMEFLNNLDQYQPAPVKKQILDNLREWSRQEQASIEWIADPMFRRLPSDLKEMFSVEGLATKVFEDHDALELQQTIWLRDVSRAVAQQSLYDPRIREWIEQSIKDKTLSTDQGDDLSLAYRLFDWTIRNIQLDPEFEDHDIIGGEKQRERRDRNTLHHQYYPWENLLYGHGDWLERGRVFTLLARQLGINVVMLVAERGDDQPSQPWVNAVLIGDDLYLFDTLLGLPLPGQGRAAFSRLTDYAAAPELLDALSVDSLRYRIVRSDLEHLVASIDATPAALSQRMKQIENRLSGKRKMVLTVAPTPLAKKLRTCKHINRVEIWPFPYRGYQFLFNLRKDPQQGMALLARLQQERQPFETRGPLMRGRLLHLRGYYLGDHDHPGAAKLYMESRISKKELERFNIPIEAIPKDSPLVMNLPEDPERRRLIFRQRLEQGRMMAVRAKDLATCWLGKMACDRQRFKVATDFLVLNVEDVNSRWMQSARYNLARSYEAMGIRDGDASQLETAIELYESDKDSPQRAGNLIRAATLRGMK
jgi:hypothetical protein